MSRLANVIAGSDLGQLTATTPATYLVPSSAPVTATPVAVAAVSAAVVAYFAEEAAEGS